ncbi:glycosyltransferase family A protein [uncultured Sphingomonas sp.]|uniref:glycosyltransferase family A protein n=1 Tax=uncultured Sphingomonas sp. TaxID=158754 RepID=UPI0035CC93F1
MSEPFTFGIPLIARAVADGWPLVEHLLGLTLRSVLAQTDADFHVVLAAHDVPMPWAELARDERFTLLRADWPPEPVTAANDDGGVKKWRIKQHVRAAGGGLLMFLDADDWVSRDLVARARAQITAHDVGAIVADGFALDWRSRRLARFPVAGMSTGAFHELCGSSAIGRVVPGSDDPMLLDPHLTLGSHHEWLDTAAAHGVTLARLDARAVYMVGTGQNHSEREGPFATWRREVSEAVRRTGTPIDTPIAHEFGQDGTWAERHGAHRAMS